MNDDLHIPTLKLVDNLQEADRVLIVDISNLAFRCNYAYRDLAKKDGSPSGHIFGTIKLLISHLKNDFGPGNWIFAACYDGKGAKALRQAILPAYKAGRNDERFNPIPSVKDMVQHLPGLHVEAEGFEGDDAIAALAEVMSRNGKEVVLLTADRDMWALLRFPNVKIFSPHKKRFVTVHDVAEDYLVPNPEKIPLVKALFGDKSDGISGVRGLFRAHVQPILALPGVVGVHTFFESLENVPLTYVQRYIEERGAKAPSEKTLASTFQKLRDNRELVETNYRVVLAKTGLKPKDLRIQPNTDDAKAQLDAILMDYGCASLLTQTGIFYGEEHLVAEAKPLLTEVHIDGVPESALIGKDLANCDDSF